MKRVIIKPGLAVLVLGTVLAVFLTGCRPEDIGGNPLPDSGYIVRGLWFGRIENIVREETQYITLELEQYFAPNSPYVALSGRVTYYVFVFGDVVPVFYTDVSGSFSSVSERASLRWEDLGRRFEWSCILLRIQTGNGYEQRLECSHPGFYMPLARTKEAGWGKRTKEV